MARARSFCFTSDATAGLQWNGFDGVTGQDVTGWGFGIVVRATPEPQRLCLFTHAHGSTGHLSVTMAGASGVSLSYGDYGFNTPGLLVVDFASQTPTTMTVAYQLLDRSVDTGNQVSANPAMPANECARSFQRR